MGAEGWWTSHRSLMDRVVLGDGKKEAGDGGGEGWGGGASGKEESGDEGGEGWGGGAGPIQIQSG